MGSACTTKNYPAPNIKSAKVEKLPLEGNSRSIWFCLFLNIRIFAPIPPLLGYTQGQEAHYIRRQVTIVEGTQTLESATLVHWSTLYSDLSSVNLSFLICKVDKYVAMMTL